MDSVRKAKQRLRHYPKLLAECHGPATAYASCVLAKENVTRGDCEQEFQALRKCLHQAAQHMGSRL